MEQPTLEEQENYDRIVTSASDILYDPTVNKQLLTILEQGKNNPAETVVQVGELILEYMEQQSQGELPYDVILPAGDEILEQIGELAQQAGIFEYTEELHKQVLQLMISKFIEQNPDIDPNEIQELINSEQSQEIQPQQKGMMHG